MSTTERGERSFIFDRFWAFFKLFVAPHVRRATLSSAVGFVVTAAVLTLVVVGASDSDSEQAFSGWKFLYGTVCFLAFFGHGIASLFFSSTAFKAYDRRETCWSVVLAPASRLEKFVAHGVYAVVLAPLLFVVSFGGAVAMSQGAAWFLDVEHLGVNGVSDALIMGMEAAECQLPSPGVWAILFFSLLLYKQLAFFTASAAVRKYAFLLGIGISAIVDYVLLSVVKLINGVIIGDLVVDDALNVPEICNFFSASVYGTLISGVVVVISLVVIAWYTYRHRVVP